MSCQLRKLNLFSKCVATSRKHFSSLKTLTIASVLESHNKGDQIQIKGWVKALRKLKEHVFFDVSDGLSSKRIQVTVPQSEKPDGLTTGSSVIVTGYLSETPKGEEEIKAENVDVCGSCVVTEGYPFLPRKTYSSDYVRQFLHFRPRTNKFASLLRVRSTATAAIHSHFEKEGFINIHTPILTSNDCEGAGETFFVQPDNERLLKQMGDPKKPLNGTYFNTKAFLTVSGQLHLESAVHGLSKVYTFGPTFRAENSRSRLHLSEFYMIEAEIAFVENLEEIAKIVEKLLKDVTEEILTKNTDDVSICKNEDADVNWLDKTFPVLEYDECVSILNENKDKLEVGFRENLGFSKEHELFLVKHCGNIPTFIINWPVDQKPFYVRSNQHNKAAALDLLAPIVGEVVGGSLRDNDYNKLKNKLPSGNSRLDWYADLRKFGGVPTGGFGLGFERYLQFVLGITNIKDTIPFPRWPHNCSL